jgi:hypothetical protein
MGALPYWCAVGLENLAIFAAIYRFLKAHFTAASPTTGLAVLSLYMFGGDGEAQQHLHYKYLDVTVESMRHNPEVDFILILVGNGATTSPVPSLADTLPYELQAPLPSNLHIIRYSHSDLSDLISQRLGIDVSLSSEWHYKMAEFKPTFGQLFAEHIKYHAWWGYADMDVVWGKFSNFAHLFSNPDKFPIVNSGWHSPRGMAAFYVNKDWTRQLYKEDPVYLELLQNATYRNLDENGVSIPPQHVVDGGKHSLGYLQRKAVSRHLGASVYRGRSAKDRLFLEKHDSVTWAGPVLWQGGKLLTVREFSSAEETFPSGRELLFYHRADSEFQPPKGVPRKAWVEDMLRHGFLLPYFIPLISRFSCPRVASRVWTGTSTGELNHYAPYRADCFNSPNRATPLA